MASIGPVLGLLIQKNAHQFMKEVRDPKGNEYAGYAGPLGQGNPSHFMKFCNGIANGISQGSAAINFATVDVGAAGGPPMPGVGLGVGIKVDKAWLHKTMYIRLRDDVLRQHGVSIHEPWYPEEGWPENGYPKAGDPKGFLSALCKGIAYAIEDHFKVAYTLNSAHPLIYVGTGKVLEGKFFGLSDSNIKSLIMTNLAGFTGGSLPTFVEIIAKTYVEAIHKHSKGQVVITGVCIPSTHQVCGILSAGVGTGVAV